jgi:hypothetical protein
MSLSKENESGTLGISIIGGKVKYNNTTSNFSVILNQMLMVHNYFQDSGSYGDIGIFVKTLAEGGAAHRVSIK